MLNLFNIKVMSRTVSLCDIDFSGQRPLFAAGTLNDPEICFNSDVPSHVKDCVSIMKYLIKFPLVHLRARFTSDGFGKYFVLQDVSKSLFPTKYKCMLSAKDDEVDSDTKKKLKLINEKLNDPDMMNLIMMGRSAGGSVVKMLLRDASYLEKYVDTINRRPRMIHATFGTLKKATYGLMGFAFISSVIVLGPAVALPYLAYVL